MAAEVTRLEVWGDPIAHSRSPRLHAAAYGALGLDWVYGRRQVTDAGFADALSGLGGEFRGLSLTYPLKGEAFRAASAVDRRAELSGVVNTLLLTDAGAPQGFNTDIGGLAADLREHGFLQVDTARIVGAGATATSALIALAELGAREVEIVARRPDAAAPLKALGDALSIDVRSGGLSSGGYGATQLTIGALPGGAPLAEDVAAALAGAGGALYDVVYDPWPTALASAWTDAGGKTHNGAGMLLQQAVLQVRIFVNGDPDQPLDNEDHVVAMMRGALVGD